MNKIWAKQPCTKARIANITVPFMIQCLTERTRHQNLSLLKKNQLSTSILAKSDLLIFLIFPHYISGTVKDTKKLVGISYLSRVSVEARINFLFFCFYRHTFLEIVSKKLGLQWRIWVNLIFSILNFMYMYKD